MKQRGLGGGGQAVHIRRRFPSPLSLPAQPLLRSLSGPKRCLICICGGAALRKLDSDLEPGRRGLSTDRGEGGPAALHHSDPGKPERSGAQLLRRGLRSRLDPATRAGVDFIISSSRPAQPWQRLEAPREGLEDAGGMEARAEKARERRQGVQLLDARKHEGCHGSLRKTLGHILAFSFH